MAILGATMKNQPQLSEKHLSLLREDFAPLEQVDADLPDCALKYVVDGECPEILTWLSATPRSGDLLGLKVVEFLSDPPTADERFFLRLAQVHDAATRATRPRPPAASSFPSWLELFLERAWGSAYSPRVPRDRKSRFSAAFIERMLVAAGEPADLMARSTLLAAPLPDWWQNVHLIEDLEGYSEMVARHPHVIVEGLDNADKELRVHVLDRMLRTEIDPTPWSPKIVALAVGSVQTVRAAAEPLLGKVPAISVPLLRAMAETGTAEQRLLTIPILWKLTEGRESEFLNTRLAKDASAKVKAVIGELLAEAKNVPTDVLAASEFPPVQPVNPVEPLTRESKAELAAILRQRWEAALKHANKMMDWRQKPPPLSEPAIEAAIGFVEGTQTTDSAGPLPAGLWYFLPELTLNFIARADLHLTHVMRMVVLFGGTTEHQYHTLLRQFASKYYFSHMPRFSLRELAAAIKAAGRNEDEIAAGMLNPPWMDDGNLNFDPDDIWPYFAERPRLLEEGWQGKDTINSLILDRRRSVILRIFALFPVLPPWFVKVCWEIAFSGNKKERPLAQEALGREPGKQERILAALAGAKAEHRAIAASWLANLGYKEAIPALKKALAKEKQEPTAGTIMVALERLGVPLDEFINMDGVLKEAKALLEKGVPKELAWFDFLKLPKVRWAQTAKSVHTEILQWMIVQSCKMGLPEAGPRLRQYASHFNKDDAEVFGQYVLESWIAQDTIPHSPDQAHKFAEEEAGKMAGFGHQVPSLPSTKEEWYRLFYNKKLLEPVGSAYKEKGILAVASACCGGRAGPVVERYLKTYYGYRIHQCRALVRMLSWVDHPSAIQVLLSVSSRFRTPGIRKEAVDCVNGLAERKNWTLSELADRTIPTAGFDNNLQLVLDFGPRTFTARLDGDFRAVLYNDEGKTIKTLPAPRKDDDAQKAGDAKKALANAKKEIDSVLKLQRERLYEAMCTQRTWTFSDWDQFLNKHPVIRHYCQRLVWCVTAEGKITKSFRPLEDRSLTDTDDETVTIADLALICLAHQSILPADAVSAWRRHLADYNVKPLFEQFDKGSFLLPEDKRVASSLDDFQGHMLEAFKLRGRLTKLGYTRGAGAEGGIFYHYQKHVSESLANHAPTI